VPLFVAILTVPRAELAAFRAYEHAATQIMARHHGAIERALVLDDEGALDGAVVARHDLGGGDTLRELHVVRFATADDFTSYRTDPALLALADVRTRCVLHTELLPATDGPRY